MGARSGERGPGLGSHCSAPPNACPFTSRRGSSPPLPSPCCIVGFPRFSAVSITMKKKIQKKHESGDFGVFTALPGLRLYKTHQI